jgi:hypothetical protein
VVVVEDETAPGCRAGRSIKTRFPHSLFRAERAGVCQCTLKILRLADVALHGMDPSHSQRVDINGRETSKSNSIDRCQPCAKHR